MKSLLAFLLATLLSIITIAQDKETRSKSYWDQNEGDNFKGFITKVNYSSDLKGSSIVMTLSGKDSTQSLTLLISNADLSKFNEIPETAFLYQYVQVTGKVEIYDGEGRIRINSAEQIRVVKEAFSPNKIGEPL